MMNGKDEVKPNLATSILQQQIRHSEAIADDDKSILGQQSLKLEVLIFNVNYIVTIVYHATHLAKEMPKNLWRSDRGWSTISCVASKGIDLRKR